ncbi:MAG TPA: type II secretion system protein [Rhodocyclaceae bacterium]|jgi:general secretion pathway protein G|nr:type II secretion system protein [Rhodocyclaceae bacterium]HMW78566.1 type II secretion system protein [Rhodocyclaceae bacterium]HNE44057.1 type II secretion system protein [Rhodocyclaceae bacterium]HNM21246.1 type II secretion system protein [Rhodocyclaceae bacterium]HNM80323.1 type II secretion system protein [Rhodocyclaceae bacterium]
MTARQRGFTLVEMAVVIAIVAILATSLVPLGAMTRQRAEEDELRHALRQIRDALDRYRRAGEEGVIERKIDGSGYPPNLRVLVEGVPDGRSADGRRLYFLRRIPRDPTFPDRGVAPEATWGLRSYASPPDAPAPGSDVFDVHSLSSGIGLNGVPYRDW